jgi:antitoxin MazE
MCSTFFDHQEQGRYRADRRREIALTLAELFKGKTPQEWRTAYAGAFNWGPDIGREVVAE